MVISNPTTAEQYFEHLRHASGVDNTCAIPNLFGVGPGRSGTTFLYGVLSLNEQILVSSVKETNFFGILQDKYRFGGLSLTDYSRLFSHSKHQRYEYCADISPVYLFHRPSLDEIRATCGLAKIIITLREPVDRVFSQFKYHKQHHQIPDFEEYCVRGLNRLNIDKVPNRPDWFAPETNLRQSLYLSDVQYAWQLFGKDNVLVLHYEELRDRPVRWLRRISEFLQLDISAEGQDKKLVNASSKELTSPLSESTREQLNELYSADQQGLRDLLVYSDPSAQ